MLQTLINSLVVIACVWYVQKIYYPDFNLILPIILALIVIVFITMILMDLAFLAISKDYKDMTFMVIWGSKLVVYEIGSSLKTISKIQEYDLAEIIRIEVDDSFIAIETKSSAQISPDIIAGGYDLRVIVKCVRSLKLPKDQSIEVGFVNRVKPCFISVYERP
jgi:hypothetical protein